MKAAAANIIVHNRNEYVHRKIVLGSIQIIILTFCDAKNKRAMNVISIAYIKTRNFLLYIVFSDVVMIFMA